MNMNRRSFVQTAIAASMAVPLRGLAYGTQSKNHSTIAQPDRQFIGSVPRLMELARLPGLGMAVVQGEKIVFEHYAGVANAKTKSPITAESLFPAASMGKQVFAYAALRLADEGRLDLDRPLLEYVSEDAPTGEYAKKITAKHILSHSSGLPNWRDGNEPLVPAFEPGTKFRYSGEGFYYLQRCVEKITGIGCEAYMQEHVFIPLGMKSSTYLWRADADQRYVSGHRGDEPFDNREFAEKLFHLIEKSGVPLAQWNHDRIVREMAPILSPPHKPVPNEISPNVAFGLLTTVTDYSVFVSRIVAPRGDALDLKPQTRALMMKPFSHVNSALSWGLGWGIEEQDGRRYLWQWGDNGGWKNVVIVHPESRSGLVVFTNGDRGMRVVERVARAATGLEHVLFLWI